MRYAEVVVHVPISSPLPAQEDESATPFGQLDQTFTYEIPESLQADIRIGEMVWVPFGSRRLQGVVLALADETGIERTRPIEQIVSDTPLLTSSQIALARWLAHRYLSPLSECVWLLLPRGIEDKVQTYYELSPGHAETPDARQNEVLLRVREAPNGVLAARLEPHLRSVAESMVRSGALVKRQRVRPGRARPQRVDMVRLAVPADQADLILAGLERRRSRNEIIIALQNAGGTRELELLCEETGCAPAAVHHLADEGIVEISGGHKLYTLTQMYFQQLPALSPIPARILVYVRERGRGATFEAIHAATGAGESTLRGLLERGYLELRSAPIQVRLLQAPGPLRPSSSRLRDVVSLLQREPEPLWVSAIYAETGANRRDLDRLVTAGLIRLETEERIRDPLAGREFLHVSAPLPTSAQACALEEIERGLAEERACAYLLHGVTGSGKTEIYLRVIDLVLKQGRQALALVPEIALTPQTIQRFGERFGDRIAVIHSELSYGERYDTWRRARDGKVDVVIGPRSALFAPLPQLGLIVIDEEHEPSYKQEPDPGLHLPPYHTREVALELARLHGATVILGSATPDVETYWRALQGEFKLVELPQRILAHGVGDEPVRYQELPPVQVVNLREELLAGNTSVLSRTLETAMRETLASGEQVILFLNRRGLATAYVCRSCGESVRCPRCNNPFTLHQAAGRRAGELVCHHCGKRRLPPQTCPHCGSTRIRGMGLGTEKLEQVVRGRFPQARVLRWDWDMTRGRDAHEQILARFTGGEADVLIGTQMIAKGLDLPRVTLVGVVNADTALNLPDFRAGERTFQLLTQVAGRAGRSALKSRAIIQTYVPEHYAVRAAAAHDYATFYEQEIAFRQKAGYPPIRPLVRLLLATSPEQEARASADRLAELLQDRIRRLGLSQVELLGPAPAFYAKWQGRYRYHLLLRGGEARTLLSTMPLPRGWRIDVDPMNLL